MSDKPPLEFVDVKGKKSFNCPRCNYAIQVPPREISMKRLEHMSAVEWFEKWHKEHVSKNNPDVHGAGNVRLMICPECHITLILKDEFTVEH